MPSAHLSMFSLSVSLAETGKMQSSQKCKKKWFYFPQCIFIYLLKCKFRYLFFSFDSSENRHDLIKYCDYVKSKLL